MEPLTAGAIALLTLLLDKTWDKTGAHKGDNQTGFGMICSPLIF
jgi:hypothetical protein